MGAGTCWGDVKAVPAGEGRFAACAWSVPPDAFLGIPAGEALAANSIQLRLQNPEQAFGCEREEL